MRPVGLALALAPLAPRAQALALIHREFHSEVARSQRRSPCADWDLGKGEDEEHGPHRVRVEVAEDVRAAHLLESVGALWSLRGVMVEGDGKRAAAERPLPMEALPVIAHNVLPAACGAQLHLNWILVRAHIEALVIHKDDHSSWPWRG